jgi:branched-chain amino acid transport system substrate-binding protein
MHLIRQTMRLAMAVVLLATGQAMAQEVKVGGLFCLTGNTSDVGIPYAQGVRDYVALTNAGGGINGKRIKLQDVDYGYKIPEAVSAYKRMKEEQVVLINGWGTGDTLAMKEFINADKIPYVSASFAGDLTDPSKTPYNFFVAPSYSDQIRAWLSWVKEDWKDTTRAPRVAFFYGDNAYGKAPIPAGRAFAKETGIEVVDEEILPGVFQDANSQLLTMKQKGADYAYINVTVTGVSVVLKGAKALGLTTKFGSNPYGFSEQLPLVAKEAAEGVTGVMPHVPFGTPVPGMKALEDFHKANHPNDTHDAMYVRGWAGAIVWVEALRRADKAGQLKGPGVRAAIETFKDFDLGGLTSPVTWTATDHRPSTRTAVYMIKDGKLVKVKDYDMPRKPEWLGM